MSSKNILTRDETIHLAKLANLHLTDAEIEKYQKQLTKIIEYINQLETVNTKKTEPTRQITGLSDVNFEDGRSDERKLTIESVLKNTVNRKNDAFTIEAIFDNKDV